MIRILIGLILLAQSQYLLAVDLPSFWNEEALNELNRARELKYIDTKSKNVIFVVGDGMGIGTLTTARILKGELTKTEGERRILSFESLDHVGLIKTYNTDLLVPDSAGTATAFVSGIKTAAGLIGVDSRVKRGNCNTFNKNYAHKSFVQYAVEEGKSVGIVTTTRVTHATPASTFAYSPDRDWESDRDTENTVPQHLKNQCPDIASQLINNGIDFQVILGGGRMNFLSVNDSDPANNTLRGVRKDYNLIDKWIHEQKKRNRQYRYISLGSELQTLNSNEVDYLFGLFSYSHMKYDLERQQMGSDEPSLSEMVYKALEILQRNKKGYVLFIEAGRIDHAHHGTFGKLALYDTLALDEAMENVMKKISFQETLMLVTADHSHVYTFGAYHRKGTPLFDIADHLADDKKAFTTILYANGPNAPVNTTRRNVTGNTESPVYQQQAAIPLSSESHSGEDVGAYASGPMAHLIHGIHEQSYLAHVVMYSACLGRYKNEPGCPVSNSLSLSPAYPLTVLSTIILAMKTQVL